MRFRLQFKEAIDKSYVIGNTFFPYHSYRWKDIAVSDDYQALEEYFDKKYPSSSKYRNLFRIKDIMDGQS
jgi:hypothetical protein